MKSPAKIAALLLFTTFTLGFHAESGAAGKTMSSVESPDPKALFLYLQKAGWTASSIDDKTIHMEPKACVHTEDPTDDPAHARRKNDTWIAEHDAQALEKITHPGPGTDHQICICVKPRKC